MHPDTQRILMSEIEIRAVSTQTEMKDFLRLPEFIYKDNECYVPDFPGDVKEALEKAQGFVAYKQGEPAGRVAVFVNQKANEKWQRKAVRFSYIDFIDDPQVAKALLDTVEQQGKKMGMNQVLGPLGVYDFDKEGMLTEGFDQMGSMIEIYNLPYYPKYMEEAGYTKAAEWVQTRMQIPEQTPKMYARVARYARENFGLRVVKFTNDEIINQGYGRKFFELFNKAYAPLFGFTEMPTVQVDEYVHKYVRIIDKRLIPVVLNDKDEIVGAAITMGSLSKAIRKSKGKMWPTGWWHFLKALKWKREDTLQLLLIAVRPDCQGYGVSALIFDDLIPICNQMGFKWAETGPQLEDNRKELSQWKPMKPEVVKRRVCYTKQL